MNRPKAFSALLVSAAALGTAAIAWACAGGFYIGSLLDEGDAGLLARPSTQFATSARKLSPKTDWKAVVPSTPETETATACVVLLHETLILKKDNPSDADREALRQYAELRAALLNVAIVEKASADSKSQAFVFKPSLQKMGTPEFAVSWVRTTVTPEMLAGAKSVLGDPASIKKLEIPAEFSLYLAGAAAWNGGDPESARAAWKKVLELPAGERRSQGIFAAYMLGVEALRRGRVQEAPEERQGVLAEAEMRFQSVREIGRQTKIDPCGLASASLGQEAAAYLAEASPSVEDFSKAAALYLEQVATGEKSGVPSLQLLLRRLVERADDAELVGYAKNPVLRPLLSSYILADGGRWGSRPGAERVRQWIRAMETSGVVDEADAIRLSLLCYQQGEYVSCSRWLQKVPSGNPISSWLMARLLLREGKTSEAAALMAKTVRELSLKESLKPVTTETEYIPVSPWRYDEGLIIEESGPTLASRIVAEQGVLALTTRDYTDALDSFLRSGLNDDAAYVAEYVLNVNELKGYVDSTWTEAGIKQHDISPQIRHLLAKRLLRERRWQESRPYFPESVHEIFDQYVACVQQGYNTSLDFEKRAAGFWHAAAIVRENGDALFMAEAGPRWSAYSGWQHDSVPAPARMDFGKSPLTTPTSDEISRVGSRYIGQADRDRRYRAAEFAGLAAALLPNNDERTSRILATAGAWLKYREPKAAEPFYKLLVIRCPDTPLGKAADALHWFPPEVTGAVAGVWDDAPAIGKKDAKPSSESTIAPKHEDGESPDTE